MSTSNIKITKLTGAPTSNYFTWSMVMQAIFAKAKLLPLIIGTEVAPTDTAFLPDFLARQADCRAEIILRVDEDQFIYLTSNDPKVCWDKLKDVHCPKGFGTRIFLRRSFLYATQSEGEDMQTWIARVSSFSQRLQHINITVDDEDVMVVLIVGLLPIYNNFIASLDFMDPKDINLSNIITRLLNAQSTYQVSHPTVKKEDLDTDNAAMAASKSRSQSGRNITCFWCMDTGHTTYQCRVKEDFIKEKETAGREKVHSGAVAYDGDYGFLSDDRNVAMIAEVHYL